MSPIDLSAGTNMIGQVLGRYEILEELGAGGMGVVYKARDTRLERFVALKALLPDKAIDSERTRRFVREAMAASALNHPNIITIHEIEKVYGRDFITMELVEGETLRSLARRPFPFESVARIGHQVAQALAVAHAAGIIHGDVKPENIMVRRDGYVKLLDFGVARLFEPSSSSELTTQSLFERTPTVLRGTPGYMSPEQARDQNVTEGADIFALGLVLYELSTGQHPFPSGSSIGVLSAILTEAPLPPSRLQPEIPRPLEDLILRMLEKEPTQRPTASVVVEALNDQVRGRSSSRLGLPDPACRSLTVGHERERLELRALFSATCSGNGVLVCVTGEPGIGKTTLVEDFMSELADRDPCIGRGRCSERLAGTEAYLPILEALENMLQGPGAPQWARLMKTLAPTWFVQVGSHSENSWERLLAEAKGASQDRMKREIAAFFQEVARIRPVLLFLDDLHWADASTIDVLAYLAERCRQIRLLIVATYRPSYLLLTGHPFVQVKLELQARGACRELPLDFLTHQDIEDYLTLAFSRHRFPAEFATLIHGRTEGNPLFMVDLLSYLRDRGVLVEDASGWSLGRRVSDISVELPESVRSMIQRKIDWLAEEDRRLLGGASVQGYEFDSAVIASALGMDAAQIEERLELLERIHGFVRQLRETALPDGTFSLRYQFVHVLYQNAFYESLRPTRRASLSAAVAQALLAAHREKSEAVASELAFLFEAAREPRRAVDFFLLAAQHDARVSANQEAVVLARRGLDLLMKLPDTPERAGQELPLRLALALPLMSLKGYTNPEVEASYNRALELCRGSEDCSQMAQILSGVGGFYFFRPRIREALEITDRMLRLAEACEDPVVRAWTHFVSGMTLGQAGDIVAARVQVETCLGIYNPRQHLTHIAMFGLDPGITGHGQAGRLSWICGYPERAKSLADDGLRLARKLDHPYSLAMALFFAAMVCQYRGEATACRELAEESQSLAAQHEFVIVLAWAGALAGWARTVLGDADEGIAKVRESLSRLRSIGAELLHPGLTSLLAELLARQGDLEQGLGALDEAMAVAEATGDRLYDPECCRLKGEVLLGMAARHEAEAERLIRRAIELARARQARSFELRAATSLARLYMKTGKVEEARVALSGTYGWFTEGFDTADLVEAKEVLRSLGTFGGSAA